VDIDGVLYCDGRAISGCKVRNLALSGAFVEVRDLAFVPNSFVAIELNSRSPRAEQILRWPARIVHSSTQGAGLMFETFEIVDRNFFEALQPFLAERILREAQAVL
jgi:hypothetical protein